MLDRLQESPKGLSRPDRSSRDSTSVRDTRSATRDTRSATRDRARSAEAAELSDVALARKMCVVEFRSGEAVIRHPDLKCFLDAGWLIESAVPQIAEKHNVELRVVLSKCGDTGSVSAEEDL